MDAGIADTLNRQTAQRVARHLDLIDWFAGIRPAPDDAYAWYRSNMANTFMGADRATDSARAWLFGALACRVPGVDFDGFPADCDWDNLFSHLRAEILGRRNPETPHAREAQTRPGVVV